MQILPVDPHRPEADCLDRAAGVLERGGLIVFPTETVYGLAGLAGVDGVREKICRTKQRAAEKPIAFFAPDIERIEAYGAEPGRLGRALAESFCPGPLTLVIPCRTEYMGFRIPDHQVPLQLMERLESLMMVTSANPSGAGDAVTAEAAARSIGTGVELVLDGGAARHGVPSTVVKIINNDVEILRAGAIDEAEIRRVVRENQ